MDVQSAVRHPVNAQIHHSQNLLTVSKGLKDINDGVLITQEIVIMPKTAKKRKKKKGEGPMPSGGAGLIRFFEDETPGIKVGPTLVLVFSVLLIIGAVTAHIAVQLGWIAALG